MKENKFTSTLKVDWSKIRLICIAKEFSKWDASLIKHLDSDIECYTYTYHKDELDIHLDPMINQFKKQRAAHSAPATDVSLEDHRNKADTECKQLLDELRKRVFDLGDDVNEGFAPEYIKYYVNTTFLSIYVRKKWVILHLRVDESKYKDPKNMAKDISHRKWSVTRELKLKSVSELKYVMGLIKQAYDYQ